MGSVCVFCGSRPGHDPIHAVTARELGRLLALRGHRLVYGGGRVGLMGAVADAALQAGGEVVGVIPQFLLDREVGHAGVRLEVVGTMHERKARMAELADAFLTLPGGLGTLEEVLEVMTWHQLGLHNKPIGFLDSDGYFPPLLKALDAVSAAGFMHDAPLWRVFRTPREAVEGLFG